MLLTWHLKLAWVPLHGLSEKSGVAQAGTSQMRGSLGT